MIERLVPAGDLGWLAGFDVAAHRGSLRAFHFALYDRWSETDPATPEEAAR